MAEITIINEQHIDDETPKNFSKGYLTLPFEGNQFKDFITGLLGKPQSITRRISGTFEIHLSDLQSLFNLVDQRIIQQNNGRLIQFTAKIFFRDKSTVQLGSYEELITYNEVKPVISDSVKLSWDYLIQFSDKSHPEKQSIEIIFVSFNDRAAFEFEDFSPIFNTKGQVRINIQHTARSWGSDIESMLTNQIKSLLKKENKFKSLIRENNGLIGLLAGIVFFLISIIGAYKVTNNFILNELTKVESFTDSRAHTTTEKLDYLTSYVAAGASSQHYFKIGIFILIMLILSVIVGAWISGSAGENREPSFVLLTRKSLENRDVILKKLQKRWIFFFISVILSLASGIISNYIFNWLVTS